MANGTFEHAGQRAGQQRLAASRSGRSAGCSTCRSRRRAPSSAERQPLVVVVDGDREHLLGAILADDVLIELGRRFRAAWESCVKSCLVVPRRLALLLEDRLAELDALAADVHVARSFDQRADVAVALATERTEGVLLGSTASPSASDVPTRGHANLLCESNRRDRLQGIAVLQQSQSFKVVARYPIRCSRNSDRPPSVV